MPKLLDDHIFSAEVRYEAHRLVVCVAGEKPVKEPGAEPEVTQGGIAGEEPIVMQGIMAAIVSALLVDTDEGERRGIAIDTDEQQQQWIQSYEREVRRDDWGLLTTELQLLSDAYIQLATSSVSWAQICPNLRLLDLAFRLVSAYMQYLTVESFGAHIWECVPWQTPFAQWLIEAARVETRRQRFIHTDWIDAAQVTDLAEGKQDDGQPTFIFEGEAAEDIMQRYFQWLWPTFQAQLREMPGVKPNAVQHRNYVVEQETDWSFILDDFRAWSEEQRQMWHRWMDDWTLFITRQLKPQQPVRFWNEGVDELLQERLTDYLRVQEKEPMRYKSLTPAVYALRQLGYVRRACSVTDITRWLTEHLQYDYNARNANQQFRRAWKELKRYAPAVKDCVKVLDALGITPFKAPEQE